MPAKKKTSTTPRTPSTRGGSDRSRRSTAAKASKVTTFTAAVRYLLEQTDLERVRSVKLSLIHI